MRYNDYYVYRIHSHYSDKKIKEVVWLSWWLQTVLSDGKILIDSSVNGIPIYI